MCSLSNLFYFILISNFFECRKRKPGNQKVLKSFKIPDFRQRSLIAWLRILNLKVDQDSYLVKECLKSQSKIDAYNYQRR